VKIERSVIIEAIVAHGAGEPQAGIASSPNHMARLAVAYGLVAFGQAPETVRTGRGYTIRATYKHLGTLTFQRGQHHPPCFEDEVYIIAQRQCASLDSVSGGR
jgi:hypothetical protein